MAALAVWGVSNTVPLVLREGWKLLVEAVGGGKATKGGGVTEDTRR
jgi:hypothetical protein